MSLETLPNELKCWVLKAAPDVATLSALVHASPFYHAVYLAFREECFTATTLNELQRRGIDPLESMDFAEIFTADRDPPGRSLRRALLHCQEQVWKKKTIRLTITRCLGLANLKFLVGWRVENGGTLVRVGYRKTKDDSLEPKHAPEYYLSSQRPLTPSYDDPGALCYAFAKYFFIAFRPDVLPWIMKAARLVDRAFRLDIAVHERAMINFLQPF